MLLVVGFIPDVTDYRKLSYDDVYDAYNHQMLYDANNAKFFTEEEWYRYDKRYEYTRKGRYFHELWEVYDTAADFQGEGRYLSGHYRLAMHIVEAISYKKRRYIAEGGEETSLTVMEDIRDLVSKAENPTYHCKRHTPFLGTKSCAEKNDRELQKIIDQINQMSVSPPDWYMAMIE